MVEHGSGKMVVAKKTAPQKPQKTARMIREVRAPYVTDAVATPPKLDRVARRPTTDKPSKPKQRRRTLTDEEKYAQDIRKAQALIRKFVPEGVSLVDELIAEREAEVAAERG